MKYYYASKKIDGSYYGVVYHWNGSGNRTILDHRTQDGYDTPERAMDEAAEWFDSDGPAGGIEADFQNFE